MSDNFKKIYNGISLDPQSSDPLNPNEGDLFYSDGTARDKGIWHYDGSDWVQPTGGGGSPYLFEALDLNATSSFQTSGAVYGQSFTLTADTNITAVEFYLRESLAGFSGQIVARLYSVSDVLTLAGKTLIASSDNFDSSNLTSTPQFHSFTFTGLATQPAGGYSIELVFSGVTFTGGSIGFTFGADTLANGAYVTNGFTNPSNDAAFRLEATLAPSVGANTTLSNLSDPTAINQDLLPDAVFQRSIGSWLKLFVNGYFSNAVTTGGNSSEHTKLAHGFITPSGSTANGIQSIAFNRGAVVFTENKTATISSNPVLLESGNTVDGNSGNIELRTGVPTGTGTRGSIVLKADTNGAKLEAQPDGNEGLAIATTQYIDNKTTAEIPENTSNYYYTEKGTLSALEALPRKSGKFYYATDEAAVYFDDGSELIRVAKDSQRNEEIFTLTATDVTNGYIKLQTEAYPNTELVWKNDGNGLKFRGDDFSTQLVGTQTQVDLLGPFSATAGDKVAVNYQSDLYIPSGIRSAIFKPDSTYGVFTQSLGTFSQFAFSAWIYLPSTAVGTQEFVAIGRTTPSNGMLLVQSGSDLTFQILSKTTTISGLAFNDGWYHIGCIFNGQNSPQYNFGIDYGRAYLNGVESPSATGGGGDQITFNNGFTSGIGGVATAWFDGSFANAHIWIDKGLVASDMAALHAAGYYTDPNAIIGKAPDHAYLFGDLGQAPADDITTIYDRVGTNNIDFNLGGNPARNIDSFSTNVP